MLITVVLISQPWFSLSYYVIPHVPIKPRELKKCELWTRHVVHSCCHVVLIALLNKELRSQYCDIRINSVMNASNPAIYVFLCVFSSKNKQFSYMEDSDSRMLHNKSHLMFNYVHIALPLLFRAQPWFYDLMFTRCHHGEHVS